MALRRERGSNKARGLCKLAIDEDMTIYAIDELKEEMAKEIDIYERFELNLGKVEEIDSAGIQLLLALRTELMQQKKELKLTVISSVVSKLIDSYGVSDHFNIGDVA